MANELTMTFNAYCENGNFRYDNRWGQLQVDQSSAGRGGHAQSIGTTSEAIDFGDVSTEGWCFLRNTDSTNYVEWGPENGTTSDMEPCGRIKAGEFAVFRLEPGITLRAKADTAAVILDVTVLED